MIEQVDAIVRHGDFAFCAAHEHDANRGECVTKFFDRQIVERLTLPARERMEEDERFVVIEARDRVTGRERETQWAAGWHAEGFNERKVALDSVGVAIDLRSMLIEKTRPLSRVAHSIELTRMTHLADERAAQEALEIEGGIRLETSSCAQPRKQMRRHAEAAELAAR